MEKNEKIWSVIATILILLSSVAINPFSYNPVPDP